MYVNVLIPSSSLLVGLQVDPKFNSPLNVRWQSHRWFECMSILQSIAYRKYMQILHDSSIAPLTAVDPTQDRGQLRAVPGP